MVNTGMLNTADSIGHAYISFGNVSKIAGNVRYGYLTMGGVDPLNATYSTGHLPTSGTLSSPFAGCQRRRIRPGRTCGS